MSLDHTKLLEHLRGVKQIVINSCHGGFSLSHKAVVRYHELLGQEIHWFTPGNSSFVHYDYYLDPNDPEASRWWDIDIPRDDPYLVQVVRELGDDAAGGPAAYLRIVEIPADVDWVVQEYDGQEWVAERHRTWH